MTKVRSAPNPASPRCRRQKQAIINGTFAELNESGIAPERQEQRESCCTPNRAPS
ncbi:hypothetical protein CALVIDRAFT_543350 [Calocera viscosa TUFC12733]|uniref:Uncharacterized protein n=1 Tax=Calocera viscosa (strain TUFC12733) TaxID=1330018 RepID=A0A167FPR1_CALVF|nr:hypothetical protein CALVIDRAFT_543350 [Calocera viscosa TUFC12733]